MKTYKVTKTVLARPMTLGEYNEYRDWEPSDDENVNEEGYLIEYTDGDSPNDDRHKGYISWFCKEHFDEEFREAGDTDLTKVSFGEAVEALQNGFMVTRKGWNGAGMFVFMQVPSEVPADLVPRMTSLPSSVKAEFVKRGLPLRYSNQFALVKPDNTINGWCPSVADTLATDWEVL